MCDPNGHWVVSLIPRLLAPTESLGVRLVGSVQAPSYHNYEGHCDECDDCACFIM